MRKRLLSAAVLATVLVTGGCAGKAFNDSPQAGGEGEVPNIRALSKALTDKTAGVTSTHVTLTGEAGGKTVSGDADLNYANGKIAMRMTMQAEGLDVSMRLVDEVLYFKLPKELEPGKPWVKLDLNNSDIPAAKALAGMLKSAKSMDPAVTMQSLSETGEIKSAEDDNIDGKPVKHYKVVVDPARMDTTKLGLDEAGAKAIKDAGLTEFPVDLWIGADNLPVRMVVDMPTKAGGGKMRMDYSDWGKPVDVAAPPAAEVTDFPTK
ncbi:MAG TPA: LppX_LprAFG lipoprotein [Actinokineospora sp.]|jgi:hypothetical protein|nr:LppX_LprAFG lipoprotein [Actinokineospora sp.]